tara:strand:+ start:60 stop:776 length:717 start_codon:yes stop_codon:yes gene_type:complete
MTSYVNFTILKSSCNYVYDKITSEEVRDQILEPFTVLVKLAILSFKAEKSKISINKNKIHIQSPNKWQGAVRYLHGTNREEISLLMKPLIRSTQLYSVSDREDERLQFNEELRYIFKRAICGIKNLRNNYDKSSSTVCHSLDYYITIIESHLEGATLKVDSYEDSKTISNLSLSTATQINLENMFKDIWNDSDISLIYNMLKSNEQNDNTTYIKSIEDLLKSKEHIIDNKIKLLKKLI